MPTVYDPNCPVCHGSGFVLKNMTLREYLGSEADDYEDYPIQPVAFSCPRCNGKKRVVKQRKRVSNLPEIMQECTMLDFKWDVYRDSNGDPIDTGKKQQLVSLFISQYSIWEKHGRGLFINSETRGSGKTFLASAICNTLMMDKYVKVLFVSASDLIPISAGEYRRSNVTMESLIDSQVLVIDDLGQKNNGKGWTEDILYEVLNERMTRRKVTIITSNYRIGDLEYDSRVIDRINKMTVSLDLPEVSVRLQEADDRREELFREIGFTKGA